MDFKEQVHQHLEKYKQIYLPRFITETTRDPSQFVQTSKILQDPVLLTFDSVRRIDKTGSIVDFIVKRGESELWIGLWDKRSDLTTEQVAAIENANVSYVAMFSWIMEDSAEQSVNTGFVKDDKLPQGKLQTIYWIHHKKHGWHYDTIKQEVRI